MRRLDVLRALAKTPAVLDAFFVELGQARGGHVELDRYVSDALCRSRLAQVGHHNYGTLPKGVDAPAIIARATPTSADLV